MSSSAADNNTGHSAADSAAAAAATAAAADDLSAPTIAPLDLLRMLDQRVDGCPFKFADTAAVAAGRTVVLQAKGMLVRTSGTHLAPPSSAPALPLPSSSSTSFVCVLAEC
jgi:hypothetical protein